MSIDDRREKLRLPMESIHLFTLSGENDLEFLCSVRNITGTGMMIRPVSAKLRSVESGPDWVGRMFTIVDCPDDLRDLLLNMRAEVIWCQGEYWGMQFQEAFPVSNQQLQERLISCEMYPWDWTGE